MNSNAHSVPIPQGNYAAASRYGDFIFTSGMTPRENGKLLFFGKVQTLEPLENYKAPVLLAVSNALKAAGHLLEEQEQLAQIVSLTVFIACDADFQAHSGLADYASEYLYQELNHRGIGSRAAIGVVSLPSRAPVEVQLIAAVCATPPSV